MVANIKLTSMTKDLKPTPGAGDVPSDAVLWGDTLARKYVWTVIVVQGGRK